MASRARSEESLLRFAAYAEECGFAKELREICVAHRSSIADVYLDVRGPTAHAARLECWWWLGAACRKSATEIARMFDRDRSSIGYALDKLAEEAAHRGVGVGPDTVRVLAIAVSESTAERMSAAGRRAAEANGFGGASRGAREAPVALSASGTASGPVRAKTKS